MEKRIFSAILIVCVALSAQISSAAEATRLEELFQNNDGCMQGPMQQFGRYIGRWNIKDHRLQPDGVTWKKGAGGRWDFLCFANGTAVQDFWMPNYKAIGTNLRSYNKDTESWDIVWITENVTGFTRIGASQADDGSILMEIISPVPNPLRRITFFPPGENDWKWKLEMSSDNGEHWLEVYRIEATRMD